MVWNEVDDHGVIVMLTQTHEAGREKCFSYFPQTMEDSSLKIGEEAGSDQDSDSDIGANQVSNSFKATVELLSLEYLEPLRSTKRKMVLRVDGTPKMIHHYLFAGWPDFSIPEGEDRLALLELVKATAAKAGSPSNARIIHCSAGVGRSGTFIALDYLLDELAEGSMDTDSRQDLIMDCVNALRMQRMMMVQGDTQFSLLYKILKEQWLERHGQAKAAAAQREEITHHEGRHR